MKICDMKGLADRICQEYGFTQKTAQDKAGADSEKLSGGIG